MKKEFIILSIVLFFLMMACVSANDANQTADNLASIDSTDNTESHIKINSHDVNDEFNDGEKVINETTKNSIEKTHEEIKNESKIEDTNNDGENNLLRQNADDSHKNENSKSNDEILAASNDNNILGSNVVESRSSVTSYSIEGISVSVSYVFLTLEPQGLSRDVTVSFNGHSKTITLTKTKATARNEEITTSVTIPGPITPGSGYVTAGGKNIAQITVNKVTPSGISVTGGSNYDYGASGSKTVYTGKVNGKRGSVTLEGWVYIYRDGSLVGSVNCNANGDFSYAVSSTSLNVGSYTYTCFYGGNTYYNSYGDASHRYASKTITVSKGTPQITIAPSISEDTYPGFVNVKFTVKNLNGNALKDIILTPNGNKFNSSAVATDSNGQASFTVTPLDAGTYSDWTVSTTETSNYKSVTSKAVTAFTIKKQVPIVNYVVSDINDVYPGGKKVTLTLTDRDGAWLNNFTVLASGSGFDTNNKITDNAGSVSFSMYNLSAGTYNDWNFAVGSTSNYDNITVNLPAFTIKPYNVTVNMGSLTPSVSVYVSTIIFTGNVNYPKDAPTIPKGRIFAQLGDISSSTILNDDGTFTIEFKGVKPGEYYQLCNVYFAPDGAEKNYVSSNNESLDVKRVLVYQSDSYVADLEVTAKDNNFTYGNRITVTGTVRGNGRSPTGNVTLYIDGNLNKVYGKDDISIGDEGEFGFVLTNAPAGTHYFTIVYDGDDYYYESNNNTMSFTVGPADMNFEEVRVFDGHYNGVGSSAYFNVTVSANGEGDMPRGQIRVNLSDNSRSWTGVLNGNNSIVYISNLPAGSYDGVTVEYLPAGDEVNYKPRVHLNTYQFNVYKGRPDFTIEAPGVGLGETAYVFIKLPGDAGGNVTLKILNGRYAGSYIFSDLAHNSTLELKDLDAGAFKITASYSGDENWQGHDDGLDDFNTTLYVERPGANVNIDVEDIDYGDVALINFTIYSRGVFQSNARGSVMVYGLGSDVWEVTISNGKGFLSVPGLAMGSYNVVAYYGGYNDLMGNINTTDFKVLGHDTKMTLSLNSSSLDKGSSILLTVSVAEDISDPIYLYVDGSKAGVCVADDGVATFMISGHSLTTGVHNVTATLLSNDKYNGVSNNTTFIVNKIMPDYSVSVVADSNKNIIFNIYVGDGASGRITIVGNGTTKRALVDEGYAEYTLTGLNPGYYTYNITYSGDDNYQGFSTVRSVNSNKLSDYAMTIINTEAASGKSPIVYVNLPTQLNDEKVYLYINDNPNPLESVIVEGVATFSDAGIAPVDGHILVRAVFKGNEYYEAKSVNKTINVDKISQYDLIISVPEVIYVGDDVHMKITCPDDVNLVNVSVNGVNKIEFNPKDDYVISDIDGGTYNVIVSYSGDDVYYSKESNITFTSIKRTPSLNVSVGDVVYGNDVIISINITDGTTGVILVTMDGAEYRYLDVTGSSNIIIRDSTVSVGDHNLSVRYVGDRIYNSVESETYNFTISKNNTFKFNVTVNEMDIVNQSTLNLNDIFNFMFEISLPADATRKVDLTIIKDGSAVASKVFNLPNNMININLKDYGEYSVSLVYSGNDNYDSKEIVFNLIIKSSKVQTEFGFDETKSLPLYSNVTDNILYINSTNYNGNVELYIDGVVYDNILISNNVGKITLPALTVGNHLFALNYDGDSNHNPYYVKKIFNVVKHSTNITIDVEAGHVSELTNITISIVDAEGNVIGDAGGYVFVNISGETQLLEVKKGVVVLNVTYLVNGTHNIDVAYRGDSRYDISNKSDEFAVDKFTTNVAVDVTLVELNDVLTIRVNYTDASGEMQVTIGEISKTLNVFDGVAVLGELPEVNGTYTLAINYAGDWKYGSSSADVEIIIKKVSGVEITVPGNVTIDDELVISVGDDTADGKLNVTIANGKMFTVDVVNGSASVPVNYLPQESGVYNIVLNYYGGSYWNDTSVIGSFHADKVVVYPFGIGGSVVRFGENASLEINLPGDVNTNLTVKINNQDSIVEIINGHGVLENISNIHTGLNPIAATFTSSKYETSTASTNILVEPNDMFLNITLPTEQLFVDGTASVTIQANVSANVPITVYINGKAETKYLNDGLVTFDISPLVYGEYVFTAIFNGDENYTYATAIEKSFRVDKNNVTLNVTTSDVVVGHDVEIKVNIDDDATGLVIVTINNVEYSLNVTNKDYSLVVPRLTNGTYSISAKYYGDDKYYGFENYTIVEVHMLIISNDTIRFGENATLKVTLPRDITTSFPIEINGIVHYVDIVDGYGVLENISGLHAGVNTVAATFSNDKYGTSYVDSSIFVNPNDMSLIITVPDGQLYVDDSAVIAVKANVSVDVPVTVYVNGKAQILNLSDGYASFTIDRLVYGDYVFTAIFNGDENYTYATAIEKSFRVDKNNITLNVTSGDVVVGHDVKIRVSINDDATGLVIVKINNVEYSLNITNKEYDLSIPDLGNGTYGIVARYYGDVKYYGFENISSVSVLKLSPTISANSSILVGEDLTINIQNASSIVDNATGKLNLTIVGFGSVEVNVFNGVAIVKASQLPQVNDTYSAVVNYFGDNNYYSQTRGIVFIINKVPSLVITVPGNVTIDDELIISVGDNSTDGKLNVSIGDGGVFTVDVIDGVAVIPVYELPQVSDIYNISVYYHSGSYWNNMRYNTTFHADKIVVYPFGIGGSVVRFGENASLEINLPGDVNTNLTVKINNQDSIVEIINGHGVLENIGGLHAGVNSVSATFVSGKYESCTANSTIQVNPNDIALSVIVPVEQLYVDQSATIKVLANVSMNNDVIVYINGERNRTLTLKDGEASFTIPKLVYGKYVFTAVFEGNENYTQKTSDANSFNVDKNNITLNVTADNVIVGHDAEVKVGIDGDATGLVIVKVDGNEYTLNATNKEYSLTVSGLGNGTHNIIVKYYGDSKYYGDENTTSFEVIKLTPSIDVSDHILIGEDLTIKIANSSSIVDNPTGKLTFTIGGNPVVVDVVNGVAIIGANSLPQVNDTYTATVDYTGDNNYDSLTESVSFIIEKVPRLIITVPANVTIDDELVISVGDETTDGKLNMTIANGKMFTVDVVNGKAVIPIKYLPQASNTYAISIDYYAGSYWNDTSVVRSFHADKVTDYSFIITNDTIKFDDVSTIRFTLPSDVNTTLTVLIEDIVKTVKITDGNGVLSIGNLHSGVNMVSTTFGNEKYQTTSANSFIRVLANDITLNITVPEEQLYVDEEAVITVQANVTINNTVTVYVNGEPMSLKLNNGKANFTIAPLVYGKYVFTAIFEGNENYTRASAEMKTFNVEKIIPTFNVNVDDLLVDEDALIEVTGLPEDAIGIVLIDINGTVYSLKISKGKGNLTVAGLKYGEYDVVANFTGDDKYYSNISTTSFNVDKNVIGEIKVSSGKIKDNKTQVTVTVAALDATGYVIIDVNNHSFAAKLLDGKTQIEVANLTMGENLFNVTYVGDDKYLSNMTNGVIVVDGIFIESGVNVTVDDIMVDGKAKFTITVFDDATGYVLLEVDGNAIKLPIFDAKAEFSLGNFKAGSYNVTVTYLGDDKYYTSTNSTTFNVFKYDNGITVNVEDDGVAGTPITIEVIGDNADATGDVTITVDGVNYTSAMKDGVASFNVTVEKAGEFEVIAKYSGNDYYGESTANESFTLDSAAVSLNITAEDIVIGEDAVIIVKLPVDATGNVTLSLRTTRNIYSSPIVDGVARFTIPDLKVGTYYITAGYEGDIKYAPVTDDTASFNVTKKNTTNMISFNVNTDDDGTNVTVNVPENATGNITITLGDKEISAPVVDGVAVINLGNITGDNNVTISYTGDDVYSGFNESAIISTKSVKLNSRITIEVADINVGENANIIVHVSEDATGNVILSISGKNYTASIANAKATFNIAGLSNGTHAIMACFQGDEKYLKSENKSSITVNKVAPSIIVSADDINVGEATNIVVEVPSDATGTVEITIGDEKYTASVSNGKAVFAIKDLANGTYAVSASYLGDAKYLTNTSSASFNVAKNSVDPVGDNKSSIKVETKDNKTVVTVDLPEDATGYVNITIDNETYNNVPVVNGTASIPVNNVSENANISVAYSGDDKYDGFNQNATATDEGVKLNAPVIVKTDKASYAAGEKASIIVAAPGDATGKLTVKVNGEVIAEAEGTDIIEYVVPAGGEFNIEVSYSGDKKYAPVTNNITFTAEKTNSTTSISVDDTTFDENATVTVTVPADATGNVTLTVGDVEYAANVTDGKAVFTLPKLGIGKYSIKAVYNGDDKYESSSADAEFSSDLNVVTENIIWGENATVSVISPSGTQGMLTVVCEKETFVVEINDTVMNFTFTGLLPGKHEVSVVYDRTSDGYQVTVKKEINVARLASNMTVSVDDVIVGNDVVIHVTVNSAGDVNGSLVSVTINGKDYNATVVNGTADIRISGLGVGKYENINVTFAGTQFVAPSVENVTFNVNVVPVNLVGGKNINVFYLEGAQYSIRVMGMDGKPLSGIKVTFKVAGKTYNVVSDANGYAKVKLNLNPGSYKITASANGKSVSNKIKVKSIISAKKTTKVKKKAKKTIIKITVKGHKVKQNVKVKFTYKGKNKVKVKFGKDMKKQKVTVKFKGKTYKVKVNGKGKGTLKLTKKVAKKLKKGKKYSLKVTFKGPKLYKKVKVTVKFNGKKYKVKTNKAGVAKFKVTKKMVKKFKKGKKVKYTITYKKDTLKRFVKIK